MNGTLDERDQAIIAGRTAKMDRFDRPRVGDYIDFADGTTRRISYDWGDDSGYQTSDGGSFYLGDGYVSFSGSLYSCVPSETLILTSEQRPGSVWIFHHDHHTRDNGVDTEIPFRVWRCTENAPRS